MTALLLKLAFPIVLCLAAWWWVAHMLTYAHQLGIMR